MINVEQLTKKYEGSDRSGSEGVTAVDNISIHIEKGEFFTLLGPSGCGKTTTLRMIAGLTQPDSGVITLGDSVLYDSSKKIDMPPHRRGLGMVFQSYAIWPHMSVAKNVAFPLTRRSSRGERPAKKEVDDRVREALRLVQLDGLESRGATDLSGGQQQRLALARALVIRPSVLLLDEPLSNLDAKLREQMRFELKKIQRELGITTVYVTHDQAEALGMSNRIAVMNRGRVEQLGHPRDIYQQPVSHFVADFIGVSNFVKGTVKEGLGEDRWRISSDDGEIIAKSTAEVAAGDRVTVSIRPEHVQMSASTPVDSQPNKWFGRVDIREFQGDSVHHQVRSGGSVIRVQTNPSAAMKTGEDVILEFPEGWCSLIPGSGE